MAEPRDALRFARTGVTLAAAFATLGGWLVLTLREDEPRAPAPTDVPGLPPMPTLEPAPSSPAVARPRRPAPIVTTRSSR